MSIKNYAELMAQIASTFPDNNTKAITPALKRAYDIDQLDSEQHYSGLILGGAGTEPITTTPTKWTNWSSNQDDANAIAESDFANNEVKVFEPCVMWITVNIIGDWALLNDLIAEVYMNGAIHPTTPITSAGAGYGAGVPVNFTIPRRRFVVTAAMISAGGGSAKVSIYHSVSSGSFTATIDFCSLDCEYFPLSIRTV